jgi:hypothetical protein
MSIYIAPRESLMPKIKEMLGSAGFYSAAILICKRRARNERQSAYSAKPAVLTFSAS